MVERLRYSEHDFYTAAAAFYDAAAQLVADTDPAALPDVIKELRDSFNQDCLFRGRHIRVSSARHLVDWSNGETNQAAIELPVELGTFDGCFIGYTDLSTELDQTADARTPDLAVVMRAYIWVPDLEHNATVLMVTAIAGADIELI